MEKQGGKNQTNKPYKNNSLKASAKFCKCLHTALTKELYRSQTCTARKQVPLGPNLARLPFLWPSGYKALISGSKTILAVRPGAPKQSRERALHGWGWLGDAAGHVPGQPGTPRDDQGRKAALHLPPVPTSNLL